MKTKKIEIKPRLKYKIFSNAREIATFLNESDRDLCLDHLRDIYDDHKFESREEE